MACCNEQLITTIHAIAESTVVLLARVKKSDATNLIQSDVNSIRVDVNEMSPTDLIPVDADGNEIEDGSAYDEPELTDIVFNSLQTDSRWTKDSTGYNVAYKFAAPSRDKTYDVRVSIETDNGDTLVIPFKIISQ